VRFIRFIFLTIASILMTHTPAAAFDPENTLFLDLQYGRVTIEMRPDLAPNHVKQIKELVREGFYDGLIFHRVIPGFMAQTGAPNSDSSGDYRKTLKAEFSDEKHVRGTVSMARTDDPDSASSQFFIVFSRGRASHLDGKYTIWGKVSDGMVHAGRIKRGVPADNPDKIIRLQVAADAKSE
jgi:peptidylprolyl isomerase